MRNSSLVCSCSRMRGPVRFAIHCVVVSLLALVVQAEDPDAQEAVVARGEDVAVAAVCWDGHYGLLVTADPAGTPWKGGWQAIDVVDEIREGLLWSEEAPSRRSLWYRLEGNDAAWSIPNGRTHTAVLVQQSATGELYWQLWLPGDDLESPGRWIPAPVEVVARMWLLATTC